MAYGLGFLAGLEGVGVWSGLAAGLFFAAASMNSRFLMLRPRAGQSVTHRR